MVINRILELRLAKAKLLGYNSHAEVSLAKKMATLEGAESLLEDLRVKSWDGAVQGWIFLLSASPGPDQTWE